MEECPSCEYLKVRHLKAAVILETSRQVVAGMTASLGLIPDSYELTGSWLWPLF